MFLTVTQNRVMCEKCDNEANVFVDDWLEPDFIKLF